MKVGEIARRLDVVPNTIRNWSKRYAPYLSPGANPAGGGERAYSLRDLNVLTFIHAAVHEGVNHDELTLQLKARTFSSDDVDIIIGLQEVMPESSQNATESHSDDFPLMVALSSIEKRQDTTDKRIDDMQQTIILLQRNQADRVNAIVTGMVIGGAIVLIVVAWVLWLAMP